jgi:hypothetical protein
VTQHTYVEMDPSENGAEDTNQGNGMEDAPEIEPTYQPPQLPPKTGRKQQDQSTSSYARKKQKAQNTPSFYTLIDDDMEKKILPTKGFHGGSPRRDHKEIGKTTNEGVGPMFDVTTVIGNSSTGTCARIQHRPRRHNRGSIDYGINTTENKA